MIKYILGFAAFFALLSTSDRASAAGFQVNLEITSGAETSSSTVTVEEGMEGMLTTHGKDGEIFREVILKVDSTTENAAMLSFSIREASTDYVAESSMELRYGATGSMVQPLPNGDSRTVKATIHWLSTDQVEALKAASSAPFARHEGRELRQIQHARAVALRLLHRSLPVGWYFDEMLQRC